MRDETLTENTEEQRNENPAMWWVDSNASVEVVLWTKEVF